MKTIGWIGLGHMGTPMARNLLKPGFAVNVYNRSPEKAEKLAAEGARPCASPREVADRSDLVFLMLSDAAAVKSVLARDDGVLAGIMPGKTVIDMSTISPEDSRTFSQMVADKGGRYLDAPVSGSVGAAQSAQLVILAGTDEDEIAVFQPCFKVLGKSTLAFGRVGNGSAAKLTINLLLGITGQALGETLVFGECLGLAPEKIHGMISVSALNTGLFQLKKEMYRRQEFPAAFMLELMTKDLGLITAAAEGLSLDLPLTKTAHDSFIQARDNGKAKMDLAAVYLELKEKNSPKP